MKAQRVFSFAKKDLKMLIREPASLFMIILFPVVLTVIFGISFGAVGGDQTVYQVGVVNMDSGPHEWSSTLIENLRAVDIVEIHAYEDEKNAQNDLLQGKIQAVMVVPENFGQSCTSFSESRGDPSLWVEATIDLYLDSGSMFAVQAIPPIIQQVLVTTVTGDQSVSPSIPVRIGIPSLVEAEELTMFDYMAPGLFAFAAIFLTMIVAQALTVDRERGLLRRINTTPASAGEFMAGHALSYVGMAVLQAALMFLMAFLVGYSPDTGIFGLLFAFLIVSTFALCCIGFGLITAAVSRSPGSATGISFMFILPQMFLGTFVSVGLSRIAQSIGKFVPSYYVTDALTSLFLRGAPVMSSTVVLDFVVVVVYSGIVLVLGVLLFEKYGNA